MSGKFNFNYKEITGFYHELSTITDDGLVVNIGFMSERPECITLNNGEVEFYTTDDNHKGLYVLINDILWPVMSIVYDAEMQLPDILRDLEITT